MTRAALEVAGPLDGRFFERCSDRGLLHLAADAVLAFPVVDGRAAAAPEPEEGPVLRALAGARRAIDGLSVTIDGRALTAKVTGTQVQTLELVTALHRTGEVDLRVVVPHDPGEHVREALEGLAGVELLAAEHAADARPSHVVHRPYQVMGPDDLLFLRGLGERLVLTHQDLIDYHVGSYHPSPEAWRAHRRLTHEALGAADAVVVLTAHVAQDLQAEDLASPGRVHVVAHGVDHQVHGHVGPPVAPQGSERLQGRPFLLCLGTDLRHKNRAFAIALLGELRRRGWDGVLVLAGPHLPYGSSAPEEAAALLLQPDLAESVIVLPAVDEAAKRWLYGEAAAILYPTLQEGFGLIPFEAAAAGTPCLFAAQSALAELFDADTARLVRWSAELSAERALEVLRDRAVADALVRKVREAGADLTWERSARTLVRLYDAVLSSPPREAAALALTAAEVERRYWELHTLIGPTGLSLVGRDGLLPDDVQRALAALARRRSTRGLLFRALRLLQRAAGRSGS